MDKQRIPPDFELIMKSNHIQQLVNAGEKLLGNPVMIIDASYYVLARSPGLTEDAIPELAGSYLPISIFSRKPELHREIQELRYHQFCCADNKNLRIVRMDLTLSDRTMGHLCILEQTPFQDDSYLQLAKWMARFALILLIKDHPTGVFGSPSQFFLATLLSAPKQNSNHDLVEEQARRVGIRLEQHRYVLTCRPQPSLYPSSLTVGTLLSEVSLALPNSYTFMYKENLVSVFSCQELTFKLRKDLDPLRELLKTRGLSCGISVNFGSLTDLDRAYRQAHKALELGEQLAPTERVFLYEDLQQYHMMELCALQTNLLDLCHPVIRLLLHHDQTYNTNHTATLYAYLNNSCSISRTSEELGVHRNTIKYRLSQITAITGAELQDGVENFPLFLSLKMLKYMGKL